MRSETRAGKRFDMILDGKDVLRESNITVTLTPSGGSVALRPRDLVRLPGATATYTRDITDYSYGLGVLSQRTTVSRFYRWDGIGTLRNLEDSSKNIVASSVFDAYGLQQNAITLASAYGFIGEEGVRGEKGLSSSTIVPQNMRARMYDPATGRFTSRDPIWDKDLYQYGNGNPWSFTDASGMQAQSPEQVYHRLLATVTHDYPQLSSKELTRVKYLLRKVVLEHDGRWKDLTYEPARELQSILDAEYHKFRLQQKGLRPWHPPQNAWPEELEQQLASSGVGRQSRLWADLGRDILDVSKLRNRFPNSERYGWLRDLEWQGTHGNRAAERLMEDWAVATGMRGSFVPLVWPQAFSPVALEVSTRADEALNVGRRVLEHWGKLQAPAASASEDAFALVSSHAAQIVSIADRYQIPPELLAGAVWVESFGGGVPGWHGASMELSMWKFIVLGKADLGPTKIHTDAAGRLPFSAGRVAEAQHLLSDWNTALVRSATLLYKLAARSNRYAGATQHMSPSQMAVILTEYNRGPTASPASRARPSLYGRRFLTVEPVLHAILRSYEGPGAR